MQGSGVDPDADGHPAVLRLRGHLLDLDLLAEVAGVEPEALHAGLERGQGHLVVEVDVGDDRHRRAGHDPGQALGGRLLVAGAPHQVGTGGGQGVDLGEGGLGIGRLGGGHRLHGDRGATADRHVAHVDLAGGPPFGGGPGRSSHGPHARAATGPSGCERSAERVGHRVENVGRGAPARPERREAEHQPGERHQFGHVGVVHDPTAPSADLLVDGDGHVAAVERQHGDEVEDPEEDVDEDQDGEELPRSRPGPLSVATCTTPTIERGRVPLASAWLAALALDTCVVTAGRARAVRTGADPDHGRPQKCPSWAPASPGPAAAASAGSARPG